VTISAAQNVLASADGADHVQHVGPGALHARLVEVVVGVVPRRRVGRIQDVRVAVDALNSSRVAVVVAVVRDLGLAIGHLVGEIEVHVFVTIAAIVLVFFGFVVVFVVFGVEIDGRGTKPVAAVGRRRCATRWWLLLACWHLPVARRVRQGEGRSGSRIEHVAPRVLVHPIISINCSYLFISKIRIIKQ
jgi:hypothetical protein